MPPPRPDVPDCPFCGILWRGEPATIVAREPGLGLAFVPHDPEVPGHTLVVPAVHVSDWRALTPGWAGGLFAFALRVAEQLDAPGMNLVISAGSCASQTVPHVHAHLVPREPGDKLGPTWPWPLR